VGSAAIAVLNCSGSPHTGAISRSQPEASINPPDCMGASINSSIKQPIMIDRSNTEARRVGVQADLLDAARPLVGLEADAPQESWIIFRTPHVIYQ
jgi:hypothetical protein